ncbi:ImmA/IrrE family metallo-endopeptidase [Sinorhizobium medicae]|nr:ImmA/IrrE family metallo-endopeptidase [Sinorhizobium medicae]
MNSTAKGNKLEDAFYEYLLDQQRRGEFLYDAHHPDRCRIHRKKAYYCRDRGGEVEFDVVIEIYRQGSDSPHSVVIFECKNYGSAVPEDKVRVFSHQLRTLPYSAKGVIVVSSRLQSGGVSVARANNIGIAKYDEHGLEVVADRKGSFLEKGYVQSQIFQGEDTVKSLKFSAFYDGHFFGAIRALLISLDPEISSENGETTSGGSTSVPYLRADYIKATAQKILERSNYKIGPVDLQRICSLLSIDLQFTKQVVLDADRTPILGTAYLERNLIQINTHANPLRERFTIAHEIGHFRLKHKRYLRSDNIIETDLLTGSEPGFGFNYERLEHQANLFASYLILPDEAFRVATDVARGRLNIKNRGHGHIFVDDQPWNRADYLELLENLSEHFKASHQVIEIKLKTMGLLNDQRTRGESFHVGQSLGELLSLK